MQWECCPDENVEEEEPQRPFRRDTYHYVLPTRLIAQHPLPRRDESRLMVLGRGSGALHHSTFWNLRDHLREGDLYLESGEMCVIPRGAEHKPAAEEECQILMVEPAGTRNTGDTGGERTIEDTAWI